MNRGPGCGIIKIVALESNQWIKHSDGHWVDVEREELEQPSFSVL